MPYYFAYGSNMDAARMHSRGVTPSARHAATLNDYRLTFNKVDDRRRGTGYANIVASRGAVTEGVLYEVTEAELDKLDRYEGVPDHYARQVIRVNSGQALVDAIGYVAAAAKCHDGLRPTREYLNCLLAGQTLLSRPYHDRLAQTPTVD